MSGDANPTVVPNADEVFTTLRVLDPPALFLRCNPRILRCFPSGFMNGSLLPYLSIYHTTSNNTNLSSYKHSNLVQNMVFLVLNIFHKKNKLNKNQALKQLFVIVDAGGSLAVVLLWVGVQLYQPHTLVKGG